MHREDKKRPIHIVGGGLAGSEAAWQIARLGLPVILHEMRPTRLTKAHETDGLAELVCSNSFRSDEPTTNAVGLLHNEMRQCDSLIISAADANKVPAGSALAVDREGFSNAVTKSLEQEPLVNIRRGEIVSLPPKDWGSVIIATGPLTSPNLAKSIREITGEQSLAFFDAIAPIIYKETINFEIAWYQSRYDKGESADYINCPMNEEQYTKIVEELISGEKTKFKDWEQNTPYFEGCLPIEVMAERGRETLAYGPMKPVGLTNPKSPNHRCHAIVQLRQDNALGTLYNMVGFQTKLSYSEQKRIFRMIPGLETAEFARLGGIHRNTFINSPELLDQTLRMKVAPWLRFAGQITGCEGYVESAALGLLAGRFAAAEKRGVSPSCPPKTTALGAILNHVAGGARPETFQPMNVNFGLFPSIDALNEKGRPVKGRERKIAQSKRAMIALTEWLSAEEIKLQ